MSQRRQRRTEPRPYVTCIKKFGNDETCSSGDKLADRHTQTDKHTHTHTLLSNDDIIIAEKRHRGAGVGHVLDIEKIEVPY